jgi:hypothetical protein
MIKHKTKQKKDSFYFLLMETVVTKYVQLLQTSSELRALECEIRFGVKDGLDFEQYSNVWKYCLDHGYTEHTYTVLRIMPAFPAIRVQINGIANIRQFGEQRRHYFAPLPKTDAEVTTWMERKGITLLEKTKVDDEDATGTVMKSLEEYDARVNMKWEKGMATLGAEVRKWMSEEEEWGKQSMQIRFLHRKCFRKEGIPYLFDLSVVQTSTEDPHRWWDQPVHYELEMECDNAVWAKKENVPRLLGLLKKGFRAITGLLQKSAFPIPKREMNEVAKRFTGMIWHRSKRDVDEEIGNVCMVKTVVFVGPSSIVLKKEKLRDVIRKGTSYFVTDKVDGERMLLFLDPETKKIYLIDSNGRIRFTGVNASIITAADTEEKDVLRAGILLDGEWVEKTKTFFAFDLYFYGGQDMRNHPFFDDTEARTVQRFRLLLEIVGLLSSVTAGKKGFSVKSKTFTRADRWDAYLQYYEWCTQKEDYVPRKVLSSSIDGLMFIHGEMGVYEEESQMHEKREDRREECNRKKTWKYSLKWKTPTETTIDFLVKPIVQSGSLDTKITKEVVAGRPQSRIWMHLQLMCGCTARDFSNPMLFLSYMLDLDNPKTQDRLFYLGDEDTAHTENAAAAAATTTEGGGNGYSANRFVPMDPFDAMAFHCMLEQDPTMSPGTFYTEGRKEVFKVGMVVEFKYNRHQAPGQRWIPVKIRHDKSASSTNYGNSFLVANDNWSSIHRPVLLTDVKRYTTEDREEVRDEMEQQWEQESWAMGLSTTDTMVYYQPGKKKASDLMLRKAHNEWKDRLIRFAIRGGTTLPTEVEGAAADGGGVNSAAASMKRKRASAGPLYVLDLGTGEGGDLHKWMEAGVDFVLGIDNSANNIWGTRKGAVVRYLHAKVKKSMNGMTGMFVAGDVSCNIATGKAFDELMIPEWIGDDTTAGNTSSSRRVTNHPWNKSIALAVLGSLPVSDLFWNKVQEASALKRVMGWGRHGFHVVSAQFMMHYMLESTETWVGFLQNVYEQTARRGYFMGIAMDGVKWCERYEQGGRSGMVFGDICTMSLVQQEDEDEESRKRQVEEFKTYPFASVGTGIWLHHPSVSGNTMKEYLIHFEMVDWCMDCLGFSPVPHASTVDITTEEYETMSETERSLSLLNRSFVYCKVNEVQNIEEQLQKIRYQLQKADTVKEEDILAMKTTKVGTFQVAV